MYYTPILKTLTKDQQIYVLQHIHTIIRKNDVITFDGKFGDIPKCILDKIKIYPILFVVVNEKNHTYYCYDYNHTYITLMWKHAQREAARVKVKEIAGARKNEND